MQVPMQGRQVLERPELAESAAPKVAGAVTGAFGGQVAAATEKLGATGVDVGNMVYNHLLKQQYEKSQAAGLDAANKLTMARQDLMYNPGMEDVNNPDGTTSQRAIGLMNRQGFGADKISDTYRQKMDEYQKNLSANLDPVALKTFAALAPNITLSGYDNVSTHQATQWRKGTVDNYNASLSIAANTAETMETPQSLLQSLADISKIANAKHNFNGSDEAVRQADTNSWVLKATEKSVIGLLRKTGSEDAARALLDGVKDSIPKEVYDQIDYEVTKTGQIFEKMALRQQAVDMKNFRFDTINKVMSGQFDITNAPSMIREISKSDMELGEALQKSISEKGKYQFQEDKNVDFEKITKDIFKAESQEEIGKYLVSALGNKNISMDRLTILVTAAMNRGKTLKELAKDNSNPADPKQNKIDSLVHSLLTSIHPLASATDALLNFFKQVNSGKSPEIAHQDALQGEIHKVNPNSVKYQVGQILTNSKGESGEVVGFNEMGVPIIKRKISGKSTSNK